MEEETQKFTISPLSCTEGQIVLEIPFPSSKREENGQKDLGLLSLRFCFCFLWAKPTSYHMSKMAGGASSWPALSWIGFWKRGQKAARQLSRGISTPGSDPNRSPCFGLITYLGSGGRPGAKNGRSQADATASAPPCWCHQDTDV